MATRGLVLIGKDTFSSVSSINYDNIFSSTYRSYKLITNITCTADSYIVMKLRAGGATVASFYKWGYFQANGATENTGNSTNGVWAPGYIDTGNALANMTEVTNPYQNTYASMSALFMPSDIATNLPILTLQQYSTDFTTQCDGFTFSLDAGNMSGTVAIYGLAE